MNFSICLGLGNLEMAVLKERANWAKAHWSIASLEPPAEAGGNCCAPLPGDHLPPASVGEKSRPDQRTISLPYLPVGFGEDRIFCGLFFVDVNTQSWNFIH